MSRIYKGGRAENRYQGVDRSVRYDPVQATSSDRQIQEYKRARMQDAETVTREISRQQQQENLELQAQQQAQRGQQALTQQGEKFDLARELTFEQLQLQQEQTHEKLQMGLDSAEQRAKQAAENARTRVVGDSIQSLLKFGGSVLQYSAEMQKQEAAREAERTRLMIEDAELEAAGLGDNFGTAEPISEEALEASANSNTIAQAQSTAANNATQDLADSNNPLAQDASNRIRQSTIWKQLQPLRNAGHSATGMYPAALQQARAEGLIRPGADGFVDAQRFSREFARMTGLMGAPREIQLKFARTAAAANANMVTAVTAEQTKATIEANKSSWQGLVSNITDSAPTSGIGQAFDQAHAETVHGNIGYNGVNSRAATRATLTEVLNNLVADGRTDAITQLRSHVYNTATGRTLGQDHDDLFDKSERESRTQSISNWNLRSSEQTVQIKQTLDVFNQDPTAENRQMVITQLRMIGTAEALEEANRLAKPGLNYDPHKKFELLEMQQQGIPINQDTVQQLIRDGVITETEGKQFTKSSADIEADKAVESYTKTISAGMKQAMMGKASISDLSPQIKSQLTVRHQSFMADLNALVSAEVRSNPGLAKDTAELSKIVEAKSQYLLNQPRYKLEQVGGVGYKFAGGIDPDRRLITITNPKGMQDFSQLQAEEIFGTLNFPRHELQATKDLFLSLAQLEADSKAILDGGQASNRTRLIARNLGLSSRALVEAQLRVNGLPSLSFMQKSATAPEYQPSVRPSSGNFDQKTGMAELMRLGVPRTNAAYLSGNIQQESSWNGQRDWDIKHIDGTDRNGGLVSWQNTAAHNHWRLRNVEQHFGRDISKISEGEQLQYMLLEMRKSYPQAYATFMNPNATDSQLRRASYQYWGYGEEGARFTYAQRLLNNGPRAAGYAPIPSRPSPQVTTPVPSDPSLTPIPPTPPGGYEVKPGFHGTPLNY
jgi:hypothetical protein